MEERVKNAVKDLQCVGCMSGENMSCFGKADYGVGCGNHLSGTYLMPHGKIFLGVPKGFNRLGEFTSMKPEIFEAYKEHYNMFNIPVWKLYKDGYTFVRGIMPRLNQPFLHIFLEDCREKVDCLEITQDHLDNMD